MPSQEPKFHRHTHNMHALVYGVSLVAGDTVEATDVYESTNGYWEKATCAGVSLGVDAGHIWVRPMPEPEGTIRARTY